MKYLLSTVLLLLMLSLNAQRIYVVHNKSEATHIVYKTRFLSEAKLVVRRTYNIQDTVKKYHWYFVDSKYRADWIVYYTSNPLEADQVVYMTTREDLLGYYPEHRLLNSTPD